MTAEDVDGWDSLKHIDIIIAIEKRLKVKFATAEISRLKEDEFKYWHSVGVGGPEAKSSAMTLASLEFLAAFLLLSSVFFYHTDDFVAASSVGVLATRVSYIFKCQT